MTNKSKSTKENIYTIEETSKDGVFIQEFDERTNKPISPNIPQKEYLINHPYRISSIISDGNPWGGTYIMGNSLCFAIYKNDVEMVNAILGNGKMTYREMYDYFRDKNFHIYKMTVDAYEPYGIQEEHHEEKSSFHDFAKDFKNNGVRGKIVYPNLINDAFQCALKFHKKSEAERERILEENDRTFS